MNFRQLIGCIFVVALMIAVLVGCNSAPQDPGTNTTVNQTEEGPRRGQANPETGDRM